MNQVLSTLIRLFFLLALPTVVRAQFNYTTNNGTITITGYGGPGGAVTIPDTITGLPVTSIGGGAFAYWPFLTSITIPNSVTNIGDNAFRYSTILANATMGNSVRSIGSDAFASCPSLTNITIPESVLTIGGLAFFNCTNLTSMIIPANVISIEFGAFDCGNNLTAITVDPRNFKYSSADGVLFDKGEANLIQCPGGKTGSYTVPTSVTNIGAAAFQGCTRLTNVAILSGVTSIWGSAFDYCTSLTAITVDALNPVYSSVDGIVSDKSQTTLILCPEGKSGVYTIPDSVTSLADDTFQFCSSLTSVTIPSSVTNCGAYAFYGCTSLTNIIIPASVSSIEIGAFRSCSSLTTVTIPSTITNIGNAAFRDCTSLTGIYFKGNAPSLGGSLVFTGNSAVTVYYLPGTTGWGATFAGLPTVLWVPEVQTGDASFGVRSNQFGFNVAWAIGMTVVVEAATDLTNPNWLPLQTNTLTSDSSYFSDPQWTNYPSRCYRIRSP